MKRVLGSTNGDGEKWWQKYYDVVSPPGISKKDWMYSRRYCEF